MEEGAPQRSFPPSLCSGLGGFPSLVGGQLFWRQHKGEPRPGPALSHRGCWGRGRCLCPSALPVWPSSRGHRCIADGSGPLDGGALSGAWSTLPVSQVPGAHVTRDARTSGQGRGPREAPGLQRGGLFGQAPSCPAGGPWWVWSLPPERPAPPAPLHSDTIGPGRVIHQRPFCLFLWILPFLFPSFMSPLKCCLFQRPSLCPSFPCPPKSCCPAAPLLSLLLPAAPTDWE